MLLEIVHGEKKKFICLDSKYTASKSRILESMAFAHIYRDSLRCGDAAPVLSIILVPANEALPVLRSKNYWCNHGVGCAILNKSDDVYVILDQALGTFSDTG